jgi:DNA mismatch repair protein MSH5
MNKARSSMGKLLMKQWFLRPLLNIDEINARQSVVHALSHIQNRHILDQIAKSLAYFKNIPVCSFFKVR